VRPEPIEYDETLIYDQPSVTTALLPFEINDVKNKKKFKLSDSIIGRELVQ
jgi:hypothetical protein